MTFGSFANAGNGKESTSQDGGAPVSLAKNADVVNEAINANEVVNEVAKAVVEEVVSEAVNEAADEVVREDVRPDEASNEALAVKVSLGNDIRRASFTPGSSFAALCELVAKLFRVDVTSVVLKYQDNEGDKITVSSDDELQEAVRLATDTHKMVRIFVDTKAPQVAAPPQAPCSGGWRHPTPHLFRGAPIGMGPNMSPFYPGMQTNSFGTFSPITQPQTFSDALRSLPNHPSPAAPTAPAAPTVNYGLPLFSYGAFSPASDALPAVCKDDVAERMRMDQERRVFKARKNAMKEALKTMKANAVTQEDKEAIKEFKAKMRAELKEAWKGFKQQKKSKRDGIIGKYVCDVTIADNSELAPNTSCVKTWRVKNDGTVAWPAGCQLILSANHSDKLNAPERVVLERPVMPQEDVAVSVPFTAPAEAGRYVAYFRLATPDGAKFGQRLWMSFIIPSSGEAVKLEKSEKSEKLIDDTFEETPCPPAQDPSSDFVVLSNLALD